MHSHANGALNVDAALQDVARIYRSITGRELPRNGTPVAPIPPEREPRRVAGESLENLARLLRIRGIQRPIAAAESALPAVDCWEEPGAIQLHVDLPGVKRDALQIHIEAGVLVIRARRDREVPGGARPAALERPVGPIERRVLLPAGVDTSSLEVELRDGVLRIRLLRRESPQEPRPIPVR